MIPNHEWQMERSAFLDSPPPRYVPPSIAKVALPSRSWAIVIFGLIFLAMGLVFSWLFLPTHLPRQWQLDKGPSTTVPGTITHMENTKLSINKRQVKKYLYRFTTKEGVQKEGATYTTGTRWKEGRKVRVNYLESDPSISVPLGGRMGEGDTGSSFVIIFPIVGLTLVLAPWIARRRRLRLLRHGWIGKGTVVAVDKTSVSVNHQQQYKIKITRTDDGVQSVTRSHRPDEIAFATMKMESAEPVTILYDRRKPKRMILPEVWGT